MWRNDLGNSAQTIASSLGYTVSGSNTLTMTNTGGNPAQINVTGGTHGIAANVKIAGGCGGCGAGAGYAGPVGRGRDRGGGGRVAEEEGN